MLRSALFATTAIAIAFDAANARANSVFMGLGDLPGGQYVSAARAVSADGSVVVGLSQSSSGREAFRWTLATGMVGLGDLPGGTFNSTANAVSADGSVVVGSARVASGEVASRWTEVGGIIGVVSPDSTANAVSADGSVVVGYDNGQAFRWTQNGGTIGLGDLPGGNIFSNAKAISADGSAVVGVSASALSSSEAFRWTQATGMVGLGGLPGGGGSGANAVSADGSVVVGYGLDQAFRWTEATGMVGLGGLPGQTSGEAIAVSADGSVVVGRGYSTSGVDAFIWEDNYGMRKLQEVLADEHGLGSVLTGWLLEEAVGISADGKTIVGYGRNPLGLGEAWLARLDAPVVAAPVPAALPIIAAALGGFGFAGWRQQRKPV